MYQIQPRTEPGRLLDDAIRGVHDNVQARAGESDRQNTIAHQSIRELVDVGVGGAFVPRELGGLGLESVHDWTAAMVAMGQADGSAGIALSMHLSASRALAGIYRAPQAAPAAKERAAQLLRQIATGDVLICSTTTERGTDNLHPLTEAVRTDDGWRVTGTKYFVTMSPIATHVALNVRAKMPEGDSIANVFLPMDTAGIVQQGDWDALGMRGSGSQSVRFEGCFAPPDSVRRIGPWGQWSEPILLHRTVANLPLVGAFLGIAQAAYEYTVAQLRQSPERRSNAGVRHAVAEMQIKLATSHSLLSQTSSALDLFLAEGRMPTLDEGHELMKDYQCAKWVVNEQAIEVVSQAMDLAGGGGFVNHSPLARWYRDVRAGPFMQPYSRVDMREYIGRVALKDLPEA